MKKLENISRAAIRTKPSALRNLLRLSLSPGIISFAGGYPDSQYFPVKQIKQLCNDIITDNRETSLQYSPTEGVKEFNNAIIKFASECDNIKLKDSNILPTTASQQGLELLGKLFLDEGDAIIVTNPSYLGALQVFHSYGADIHGVESNEDGFDIKNLEKSFDAIKKSGKKCKFVYLVPDFKNPSGVTVSQQNREKILQVIKQQDTFLVEDTPYRQIRFSGTAPTTFYELDNGDGYVISLFTFSKILSPGFRLGYVIASEEIISKLSILKQPMDLCATSFGQVLVSKFIEKGYLHEHMEILRKVYREKRDVMLESLEKYMPSGVSWTHPQGGLFIWINCPKNINTTDMVIKAIDKKVVYIAGESFFHDASVKNTMRLNFSQASKSDIDKGIKILSEVIKDSM